MDNFVDNNLKHYPLPFALAAYLRHVDECAQRMAKTGVRVAPKIVLSDIDYAKVDEAVRSASNGQFRAATVQWNGRFLCRSCAAVAA